jgi:hypothetical protein
MSHNQAAEPQASVQTPESNSSPSTRARRRALRAAQVVTLGLALTGGCYRDHGTPVPAVEVAENDAGRSAGLVASIDAGSDAGSDAGFDAGLTADAGQACDRTSETWSWTECCDALGWPCDDLNEWGCCAWGPYVPPGDALPESRVITQAFQVTA